MSNFTRPISGRSNRTGFVIYLLAICVDREKVEMEEEWWRWRKDGKSDSGVGGSDEGLLMDMEQRGRQTTTFGPACASRMICTRLLVMWMSRPRPRFHGFSIHVLSSPLVQPREN